MTKFITLLGIVEIGDLCFQSYPCQHYVRVNGKSLGLKYNPSIKKLFLLSGRPDLYSCYHGRLSYDSTPISDEVRRESPKTQQEGIKVVPKTQATSAIAPDFIENASEIIEPVSV